MIHEAITWTPVVAPACGVVAGLGVLHSVKRAFALAAALVLIQMAAWMMILMIARVGSSDKSGDWSQGFALGFFVSLMHVFPYTAIGATISGAAAGWLRRSVRLAQNLAEATWSDARSGIHDAILD